MSQHTIKNYLFRVFDKLGVSSRVELLFMTLSQASPAQSLLPSLLANPANGNRHDEATLAICQKAAEQGLPPHNSRWRRFTRLDELGRRTWCTPICGS